MMRRDLPALEPAAHFKSPMRVCWPDAHSVADKSLAVALKRMK